MNADLLPALMAAGGGSLLLAGIWTHEHRRDRAMRESRVRLALRFPIGTEPRQALATLDGLAGLPYTTELVAEVAAAEGEIAHALWVTGSLRSSVTATLTGVMPGLRLTEAPSLLVTPVRLSLRLSLPTPCLLSEENAAAVSRSLLAGLAALRPDEQVVVRWALRPGRARSWREPDNPDARTRELSRAWRRKTGAAGFTTAGLVLVRASSAVRARQLAGHIQSTVRSRRGLDGQIRITGERGSRTLASLPRTTRSSGWLSGAELLGLLGWPLGAEVTPGVTVGAARELPVPRQAPRAGRVLLVGRDSFGGERPVALSVEAAKHHLAVVGPTGVGKSSLLANCVLADMAQGFGGVVLDPKGPDLINTILERVPSEQAGRAVVLDPGDDTRLVAGVRVLGSGDPDLAADMLTGALRSIFADVWGVRSDYYARLAIRSLAEMPGATLADISRLFYDTAFRRMAVARLSDPFLVSAWQGYEALSDAAKAEHVQAPMNRVMGLLARPRVRAVLASPQPKLDIASLLAQRHWLLISLSPGEVGEAAAALLGSALLYAAWSAIEARSALPPAKRRFIALYIDELASLTGSLPFSFELLAERARGLGAGLTVATQTLGRVPEPARSALLGNAASFITFRAPAEEAARIARQLPGLNERDVIGLSRFEVAARIGTGLGSAVAVLTGRTLPLPPVTGLAEAIRERSAERYGTSTSQPEPPAPAASSTAESARRSRPGRTGRGG
jgi:hypothetical protein